MNESAWLVNRGVSAEGNVFCSQEMLSGAVVQSTLMIKSQRKGRSDFELEEKLLTDFSLLNNACP